MATVRKRTWTTKGGEKTAWLVDYKDQAGKRRFQTFTTQKAAKAWLSETQHEITQGTHTPTSTSITISEAADIWLERGELKGLERSTMSECRRHVRLYIKPMLGQVKLAKLTTPGVETFKDKLLKDHSRSIARRVVTSLKGILREAQRRGLVAQNVALGVTFDMDKRGNGKLEVGVDIPSKAEIQTILSAAEGRWRPLLVTAVFTGMRASELRGLTWDDLDFNKKVIHIRQRANLWGDIGAPKSAAGHREIPMSPMVVNALKEWKLQCPKGELNLVFPNGIGKVESHQNIAHRGFYAIQTERGIVDGEGKPKYGLHALRHFFASWAIERGFSPKRVQDLMGHSSIQMTFDRYGHLFPSLEDDHQKFAAGELDLLNSARA